MTRENAHARRARDAGGAFFVGSRTGSGSTKPFARGFVGLGAFLALAGCGTPPPASQFPTADDALGRMHACYDCSVGVQGNAKIDYYSREGRRKSDLTVTAVVPDRIRFEAEKFGVLVLALASDGTNFQMFNGQEKEFLHGPASACNLARLTRVPVPGSALVSLLRGEAPVLVHTPDTASIAWNRDHGYYVVNIQSKNNAVQEIHLEIPSEDFGKPWKEQRVRVRNVKVTQAAVDLYEVDLSDFKAAKTAKPYVDSDGIDADIPPSGPACAAELPHSIEMRVPNTQDEVTLDWKDGDWNPPLGEHLWTLNQPGGTHKAYVDCH